MNFIAGNTETLFLLIFQIVWERSQMICKMYIILKIMKWKRKDVIKKSIKLTDAMILQMSKFIVFFKVKVFYGLVFIYMLRGKN